MLLNDKKPISKKMENLNELVPSLLNTISSYEDNLRNRVKINNIFNEFELNTHGKFVEFIGLSDQRYKRVKSGANISRILFHQKHNYEELSNQILSNRFYTNNEIEKEAKKLLKKMNNNDKEIYQLRKGILKRTKDFTLKEEMHRNRLTNVAMRHRKEKEKRKRKYLLSHFDLIYRPGFSKKKKKRLEINLDEIITSDKNKLENKTNELVVKKKYFNDLMENDCINLNKNIKEYKDYLKEIEKVSMNDKYDKERQALHKKKFELLKDDIKLLSYKGEETVNNAPIKVEEPKIDIIKLMRFTKRGNKKFFKEELKRKSMEKIKSFKHKYPKLNFKIRKNFNILTNLTRNNSGKSIHTSNHINSNSNTIKSQKRPFSSNRYLYSNFSNYKNTIKTVENEAEKALNLKENINYKKNEVNSIINSKKYLLQIKNYENLIKHNSSFNKNNNSKVNNNCYNLYKLFNNNAFHKKLQFCGGGFRNSHRNEKTSLDILNETKKYLKDLNEVKLKQKKSYDSRVKQCLEIYKKNKNEILNIGKNDESFSSFIKSEKNIKKSKNLIAKKKWEDNKMQKEEELNMEYFQKIKQNLENSDSQNVNGYINIKSMLSKGLVKIDKKNRGYEDFQEFFEITKDKKAKNLDDGS